MIPREHWGGSVAWIVRGSTGDLGWTDGLVESKEH
jgi:hypothetical protein